jgi:hypothetical protein
MYRNLEKPGSRIYRACRTAVDVYENFEKLAALRYCYDLGGCVTVKIVSIQGSRRLTFCSATPPLSNGQPAPKVIESFKHLLIVFGRVAGLEPAVANDPDLATKGLGKSNTSELFDAWVNLVPRQGSRTICIFTESLRRSLMSIITCRVGNNQADLQVRRRLSEIIQVKQAKPGVE